MRLFSELLILLTFFHLLADYPLQGDFLSKAKNRHTAIKGIPYLIPLLSHAFIHAAFVFLCTRNFFYFWFELVAHACIDKAKCEGKIDLSVDQILHISCKLLYIALTMYFHNYHSGVNDIFIFESVLTEV